MFHGHFHKGWGGFAPERFFHKGDFKYMILDLLKEKPRYGYEIIRALEEQFHGFYAPSPGAVYPTLQMLEEMSYVTAAQQDSKKVYTITEAGLAFLAERENVAEDIKSHIKSWWNPALHHELHDMMHELRELGRSLGQRTRNIDAEKLRKNREVIYRAKDDIGAILRE